MNNGPKISNVEWGLVIGALFMVDIVQIVLDLLAQIGVILNRFIDIVVGMALAFYLQMRGQSMANPKRLMGIIGTFVLEEIPDVDALPFWFLDGIYNMLIAKSIRNRALLDSCGYMSDKIYLTALRLETTKPHLLSLLREK